MSESKIIKSSKWVRLGIAASNTETTFEVPETRVYWLLTGHNSTPECNTLWVYRSGASAGEGTWQIAGAGTGKITLTNLGNNRFKVKSTGGTISVDYYQI